MGKILGAAIFKENGFTLAEVLITLGIIGVVAAMTIPTLMTHLNHIKLQSQFKEGYSLLAQAVKMYNEMTKGMLQLQTKIINIPIMQKILIMFKQMHLMILNFI